MITRRFRASLDDLPPVSIPYATGPAVLLTSQGLSVVGTFPDHGPDRLELALAEYSGRARCHGMIDYSIPARLSSGRGSRRRVPKRHVDDGGGRNVVERPVPGVVEPPRLST